MVDPVDANQEEARLIARFDPSLNRTAPKISAAFACRLCGRESKSKINAIFCGAECMGRARRTTLGVEEEIIGLYRRGLGLRRIENLTGIGRKGVKNMLKRRGIPLNNKRWPVSAS